MKTAISIPDQEFIAADKLAKQLDISRSELYRLAIADYIARHSDDRITDKLNEVYGSAAHGPAVDGNLQAMQAGLLAEEKW